MKYKIWLHMDFPKTGCFSDVVMLHDINDSIYVRALNLVDIIQSTYLMNVNHDIMSECDYGFNLKHDETMKKFQSDKLEPKADKCFFIGYPKQLGTSPISDPKAKCLFLETDPFSRKGFS